MALKDDGSNEAGHKKEIVYADAAGQLIELPVFGVFPFLWVIRGMGFF